MFIRPPVQLIHRHYSGVSGHYVSHRWRLFWLRHLNFVAEEREQIWSPLMSEVTYSRSLSFWGLRFGVSWRRRFWHDAKGGTEWMKG